MSGVAELKRVCADLWDRDAVRVRVEEAVDSLRRLPMPKGSRPRGMFTAWPDHVSESFDQWVGYNRHEVASRPAAPSARAIQRMDETLEWLRWIEDADRRKTLVMACWAQRDGRMMSLRRIGKAMGISHQTAANWRDDALDSIAKKLN
ncbi:MAG: DUF6362 family protein [Magnetospiraceae bacterium]